MLKTGPAKVHSKELTLSRRRSLSYRNQSIDLQSKWMERFLYDRDLRHGRVYIQNCKVCCSIFVILYIQTKEPLVKFSTDYGFNFV